jgi:hypothetical protein
LPLVEVATARILVANIPVFFSFLRRRAGCGRKFATLVPQLYRLKTVDVPLTEERIPPGYGLVRVDFT